MMTHGTGHEKPDVMVLSKAAMCFINASLIFGALQNKKRYLGEITTYKVVSQY